jgi:homopolymeric O-antigen transport system permease protein
MLRTLRELWQYRELTRVLVDKELKLRYRRSVLGFAWTMLNPLLTMLILSGVFAHVMRAHIERFPVFVLAALLPWNFFAQSVSGGSFSIIHNESLLKNVRVPRAAFPIALVSSHLVNMALALIPLALVMIWQGAPFRPALLMLPWAMFSIWAFTSGVTLALSAGTVFFRDLGQIVEVSLTALFYVTPVFYPFDLLPDRIRHLFLLNPLVHFVQPFRDIVHGGTFPSPESLLLSSGLGVATFLIGLQLFRSREHLFLHYLS